MTAASINPTTGSDTHSVGTDPSDFVDVPASLGNDTIDLEDNRGAFVSLDYSSVGSIAADLGAGTIQSYSTATRTTLTDTDTVVNRPDSYDGAGVGGLRIRAGAGNDVITGGAPSANPSGTDYYYFEAQPGLGNDTITGAAIPANATAAGMVRDGEIFFTNRVDWRTVGSGVDVTVAMTGGGSGTATYAVGGTTYTDTLVNINSFRTSSGNDSLRGDELANQFRPGGGNDTIDGGGGFDEVRYLDASSGANVNLATGVATDGSGGTDSLTSIEIAVGGSFDDTLVGSDEANALRGDGGADELSGAAGTDTLTGGEGNDMLYGGAGDDVVYGNMGADLVTGDADNDTLYGGQDADTLDGGAGNDDLRGDLGNDAMTGGAGADRFFIDGADTISDFNAGEGDLIGASGAVASTADSAGGAVVQFSGGASVTLVGVSAGAVSTDWFFIA